MFYYSSPKGDYMTDAEKIENLNELIADATEYIADPMVSGIEKVGAKEMIAEAKNILEGLKKS